MNSRQLQYAVLLSQVLNFSQVAESLNITQPALSKQIKLLEKDLGVELFDRNYVPLRLTPAGEHFIKEAKELLYKEDQLKRSMNRFRSGKCGRLTIGISPFRCLYLIPSIAQKMRERYPEVEINLYETGSDQLRKDVAEGKLDFAIVNLPVDDSVLEYIPIEPDILVLAVPNDMLDLMVNVPTKELSEIDFKDCAKLPFVVAGPSQEMRRLFDRLCAVDEIRPRIAMEVVGLTTAWAMARAGIGATLLPLQFINGEAFERANLTLFKIKDDTYRRQPAIVMRRGQYMSEYAEYAIRLLNMEK